MLKILLFKPFKCKLGLYVGNLMLLKVLVFNCLFGIYLVNIVLLKILLIKPFMCNIGLDNSYLLL